MGAAFTVGRKLFPLSIGVVAARDYIDRALPAAGHKGKGLSLIGHGDVPELTSMIAESAFPRRASATPCSSRKCICS